MLEGLFAGGLLGSGVLLATVGSIVAQGEVDVARPFYVMGAACGLAALTLLVFGRVRAPRSGEARSTARSRLEATGLAAFGAALVVLGLPMLLALFDGLPGSWRELPWLSLIGLVLLGVAVVGRRRPRAPSA
jgi:drug/metabolite transporter (DMT)-like permease